MKKAIQTLLQTAVANAQSNNHWELDTLPSVMIERARDEKHGEFACNIAMQLAKPLKQNPRQVAQAIIEAIPSSPLIKAAEIAGPGFINIRVTENALYTNINDIFLHQHSFGRSDLGRNKRVHIEILSANPTGPLHVGHGRHAAYGACVADLLEAIGYQVHREYYVNDAGRQMDILATSVWLRYLQAFGAELPFPTNAYKGDYIIDIANDIKTQRTDTLIKSIDEIFTNDIPPDAPEGDKEKHIDALIQRAQTLLGKEDYQYVFQKSLNAILDDIRDDLAEFGVQFQAWFPESDLVKTGDIKGGIERLKKAGHLYEKEGALWFRATQFGDEKDRVVIRKNGQHTYFAADIGYHFRKFREGFDLIINVFGADHHGYAPRIYAFLEAAGEDKSRLIFLISQFAILYRGKEKVQMSTRGGKFVTLRELREEVGNDAARFFYVMRKREQHLDFDLELAKSRSNENPVYYIQYAHARICSVFNQLTQKEMEFDETEGLKQLSLLQESHEQQLIRVLSRYPEVIESAGSQYEPHQLAHYLGDVATALHSYYNAHQFLVKNNDLRHARLALIFATRIILANGLKLLGVSAPEAM